jgi:hypothetical protein
MWKNDQEHLCYLADEISKLEEEIEKSKVISWINGFCSSLLFVGLMWLLHR